jgi:hypothetical protein
VGIRLVAVDIDGTLLDSRGQVPAPNREALADAIARGVEVALVSGRAHHFTREIVAALAGPLTLILSNGAVVKDSGGTTRLSFPLAAGLAREVLDVTRAYREDASLLFDRDGPAPVVYERTDWSLPSRRAYYERNRAFIGLSFPLEEALTADPIAVSYNGPVSRMREVAALLRGGPLAGDVSLATTEYEARDFALLDVIAAGCSKGHTLAVWAASRGIAPAEVMAVGDNLNDVEMLEQAGCPVVMGNAVQDLRRRGWPVTGSNDAAGLAEAIERFVFGTRQ